MRVIAALLFALALLVPAAARAATFEESMQKLGSTDSETLAAGIAELGVLGEPRAIPALEALADDKLLVDSRGNLHVKSGGQMLDAITGKPSQPEGATRMQATNNRVRRNLSPAIAQLKMVSPDVKVRLSAAADLARFGAADAAPVMRKALEAEKDEEVRDMLAVSLAKIELSSDDPKQRLAALATIRELGDVSFRPELERMVEKGTDGTYGEKNDEVRARANEALGKIKSRIALINVVANMFYGISLGSVLLLAALGLAITFGLMRVINMAHGELIMLGAYSAYVVQNFFQAHLPSLLDWYVVAAIPIAFVVSGAVGIALERGVIRFLYGRPLETLLATWGLSLILIQTVRMIFGAQNVTVANPSWLSGGWELMPTVVLPYSRLGVIAFVVVVVTFVYVLLQKTSLGLYVRAVTQNREMAAGMGIRTRRIDMWTFGLGSGVAGLGGVALSQLGNVGPELGQGYIVDSFMVVVVGGVGNIVGTIAGALGLGILNKYMEPLAGAVLGKIIILGLLILFIQKRPQGIFALKGRAAEA